MRDHNTGIVTCRRCGAILGNYLTGDFYKLIKLMYCPTCKESVRREQKRFWASDHRKSERELNRTIKEQNRLVKAENEFLRERLFGTEGFDKRKYKEL